MCTLLRHRPCDSHVSQEELEAKKKEEERKRIAAMPAPKSIFDKDDSKEEDIPLYEPTYDVGGWTNSKRSRDAVFVLVLKVFCHSQISEVREALKRENFGSATDQQYKQALSTLSKVQSLVVRDH